jgi:acyl dehydratase
MIAWFDDLHVGMRFKTAGKLVTLEDMKRFAAEFDPQPYHLDEAAAEQSVFKGLVASGWHTAAISMRLAIEARPFGPHPMLGLGVDELRWLAPVRSGDMIRLEGEVTEVTPSKTRPQGVVKVKWTAYNQNGTPVYTFIPIGIIPRAPKGKSAFLEKPAPQFHGQ